MKRWENSAKKECPYKYNKMDMLKLKVQYIKFRIYCMALTDDWT